MSKVVNERTGASALVSGGLDSFRMPSHSHVLPGPSAFSCAAFPGRCRSHCTGFLFRTVWCRNRCANDEHISLVSLSTLWSYCDHMGTSVSLWCVILLLTHPRCRDVPRHACALSLCTLYVGACRGEYTCFQLRVRLLHRRGLHCCEHMRPNLVGRLQCCERFRSWESS